MVSDTQMFVDTKQVIVPPVEQFLSGGRADREQYQPREEGTLALRLEMLTAKVRPKSLWV
jgi:hypothetical protein